MGRGGILRGIPSPERTTSICDAEIKHVHVTEIMRRMAGNRGPGKLQSSRKGRATAIQIPISPELQLQESLPKTPKTVRVALIQREGRKGPKAKVSAGTTTGREDVHCSFLLEIAQRKGSKRRGAMLIKKANGRNRRTEAV